MFMLCLPENAKTFAIDTGILMDLYAITISKIITVLNLNL